MFYGANATALVLGMCVMGLVMCNIDEVRAWVQEHEQS
jgi:hypothetical protein